MIAVAQKQVLNHPASKACQKTEIGDLPPDWSLQPLGKLIHSVEYGSSAKSSREGDVPVLRMGNMQNGKIDWNDLVYTSDQSEVEKYLLSKGDVLFNRTNTIDLVGKCSMFNGERPSIFAGYLIRINCDPSKLNARYLMYTMNTEFARKHSMKVLSVAVGQANINGQKVKTYPIPVPPTLAEQEAIASALSDADALIESLEQLLAKKRLIKQGAMQELLTGKRRLPGFGGEWIRTQLTDIAKLESGHTPSRNRPDYWDGDIPWVSLHDSKDLEVDEITTTALTVSELGLANSSARLLSKGTVVFSRTATIGKSAVLGRPMATSQDFANYVCGPKLNNHFLVRLFRSMQKEWAMLMAGSTHSTIYMPTFKRLAVSIPAIEEQIAIVDVVRSMESEIRLLSRRLEKARHLKQAMMQQLLTGKIRLV